MLPLLIHELVSPFIYVCLDESVCTALLLEKSRQRTEYLPDFSVDVPETGIILLAASVLFHAEMKHLQEVILHFR